MHIELIRTSFLHNKSSIVLYMEKKNNNILLLGIKEDNLIYLTYQIDFKTYNEIRTKMLIAEQQNHEHGPLCSAYITFTR